MTNPYASYSRQQLAELSRWTVAGLPAAAWLAGSPDPQDARAKLVRLLDRPGRGGLLATLIAEYLSTTADAVLAEHHPRKAARLAAEARARGDDPHADTLQSLLVALMHCANCGRPLRDPVSVARGIGCDCWPRIDPAWRASIERRLAEPGPPPVPVLAGAQGGLW